MFFTNQNQRKTYENMSNSSAADGGSARQKRVWRLEGSDDKVRPVFRSSLHDREQNSSVTFYGLKEVKPQGDWEKAWAGLNIAKGEPLLMQIRQRSYGAFLDGQEDYRRITWEELRNASGTDINEKNYMRFVPKSAWERLENDNYEKPLELPWEMCVYSGEKPIDYFYVKFSRHFGSDASLFRKCPDGWRAFYISNAVTGETFLPLPQYGCVPTEDEIDGMLRGIYGWDIYDRLLTDEEEAYFWHELNRTDEKDFELWNDMYGATHTFCLYGKSGIEHVVHGNTNYTRRIALCIDRLAKRGAIFLQSGE